MLWCLGNGKWDAIAIADRTLPHTAVLGGRVWHWDKFGFGQCQKAPRVLGDPNSRGQVMEKWLYILVKKWSPSPSSSLLWHRLLGVTWIQWKWPSQMGMFCCPVVTVAGVGDLYRTGLYIQSYFLQV